MKIGDNLKPCGDPSLLPPRLLVVGVGFLGLKLLELLQERKDDAWGLRRGNSNIARQILACDITRPADLSNIASQLGKIDTVVHCASSGRGGAEAYQKVFLEGTNLLLKILNPDKFLFVSSTSVYPQVDGSEVTEESEAIGTRETSKILLEAEHVVLEHGGTVVRCAGIYGPGRSVILKRFLTGDAQIDSRGLVENLKNGRLLNQIHRDDAASALAFLLKNQSQFEREIFNLSDAHPMTQVEVYRGLIKQLGGELPRKDEPDMKRKRAWTHKAVSSAKLQSLGWKPLYPDFLAALENDERLLPSIQKQIALSPGVK